MAVGLPVGIVLDGANRHEVKLLEDTLKSMVAAHPGSWRREK
jgi:hypothetical protein